MEGDDRERDGEAVEVDARGLRCPLPVIRLAEAARDAPAGTRIVVLATDPAARYDIPAWCRMRDHELRELREVADPTGADQTAQVHPTPGDWLTAADERAEGARPAYLRFVVVVGPASPQRSKAAGTGNESERSSRAR